MIGWWILGILLLVILLLCLTRVGVLIRFGEELTVSARFGFLKFQVLPEKKKPPKNEKKPEEAQKKQTQKQEKPKKAFPKPTLSDIRDAWKALWPPLKKALRRTRRGVRIDPLDVSVILGGTGGTCGRRAVIRRAARGRLDRDAGAGTAAGDPPAAYPPGC